MPSIVIFSVFLQKTISWDAKGEVGFNFNYLISEINFVK